ncbi:hypothetical protein [Cupriavidus sp. H18C1]|uniref:hypothetical protein n=1 Tax=Cupriavidus sp. H18C1 TaxID=3241601 RepID=UPI003BB8C28D
MLAGQLAQLACIDRDERRDIQRLAHELCRALERLPLADRVDAALLLSRNPTLSITDRVRSMLVPDSCWVLAARVVPAAERRRVIDGLTGLLAQSSRLSPSKAVPMAMQALQLAELDPAASAHALAALLPRSSLAMLMHGCAPDARGGGSDVPHGRGAMEAPDGHGNHVADPGRRHSGQGAVAGVGRAAGPGPQEHGSPRGRQMAGERGEPAKP